MSRVLVTGASGMLGYDVCKVFSKGSDVFPFSHKELDITDEARIREVFKEIRPDIVINCAAYTQVDLCEEKKELAFKVNGQGVHNLSKMCDSFNAFLVHVSTDYVFSGKSKRPYKEDDDTSPINVYGASKLEGERKIQDTFDNYIIARTSWLFGKNGKNFIKTILELSKKLDVLRVVDDQIGRPTYTKDLAQGIKWLLDSGAKGIFHVANEGSCSWYELARFAIKEKGIDAKIIPVDSNEFKRPAKRPSYSVLDTTKFKTTCGRSLRHWEDAVRDYVSCLKLDG